MSRTVEARKVESRVSVYRCDRCFAEMPGSRHYGVTRPGEGAQLSSRGDDGWQPLIAAMGEDNYSLAQASNIDLCASCLDALREWIQTSNQDTSPEIEP